ncbi:hypothetical protein [Sulfuricystis thermophila]|uniref:hypothetical protein n=1 Tax=Sulfuricystis thermophila TaxID=2496847 RepID=UPI003D666818
MTQEQLALALDVDPITVSRFERGGNFAVAANATSDVRHIRNSSREIVRGCSARKSAAQRRGVAGSFDGKSFQRRKGFRLRNDQTILCAQEIKLLRLPTREGTFD